MKITITKSGTYTISGITPHQLQAMEAILGVANERCFDEPEDDGCYYSNDDFVCCLYEEERTALKQICGIFDNSIGRWK